MVYACLERGVFYLILTGYNAVSTISQFKGEGMFNFVEIQGMGPFLARMKA